MGSFKFLEHISDVYIEVQANNLSEAFEEAGKAVFAIMTNLKE
ncbi:MAG: archease, partial [Promethearchaeota archaeon]